MTDMVEQHPADPSAPSGLARRGLVEGFYGAPWTHEERLDYLDFAAQVGLDEYVYAPKDDPYHRAAWRDLYPDEELARISDLVAAAERHGVKFTYAIAPALSMRFHEEGEHATLRAKAEQLWDVGVRSFSLLFDDVPIDLGNAEDRRVFGAGGDGTGRAHGRTCARFVAEFLRPRGVTEPLLVCPTDYAGNAPSPYRDGLAEELPLDALIMWTGRDIVVGEVTREDIDRAAASYRRKLVLWDNFPVNDFDRTRVFLGPLLGRTGQVAGSALVGVFANPMVESLPSRFALATVAEWAADPAGYDPDVAAARALDLVAGDRAETLGPLVRASSSWPPSASRSPRLEALCERALEFDADAIAELEHEFRLLAASGELAHQPTSLERALEPWLLSAHEAGIAGLAACGLLRRIAADEVPPLELAVVRAVLARTEMRFHDVLRTVVSPFVHRVLALAGGDTTPPAARRRVLVLTGENPAPGDRELAERLHARGVAVDFDTSLPDELDVDVLIVTSRTAPDVARSAAPLEVPVLTWGRALTLGLATETGVDQEGLTLDIVEPGHPLAADLGGRIRVHRAPGKLAWFTPGDGAQVIARGEHGRPAIAYYPAGAILPQGEETPAARVALFLADEGAAPWLVSPEGHALVAAAVEFLAASADDEPESAPA